MFDTSEANLKTMHRPIYDPPPVIITVVCIKPGSTFDFHRRHTYRHMKKTFGRPNNGPAVPWFERRHSATIILTATVAFRKMPPPQPIHALQLCGSSNFSLAKL